MPKIMSDEEEKKDEGNFGLIEPGKYLAEIQSSKKTKKDGTLLLDKFGCEYWNIALSIVTECPYFGRLIFDNIYFEDKPGSKAQKSRTKAIFAALGFDVSGGPVFNNPEILVGKTAMIEVVIDEYEGKKQNKVKFFGGYHIPVEVKREDEDIPF
jgi:hypothetical protein